MPLLHIFCAETADNISSRNGILRKFRYTYHYFFDDFPFFGNLFRGSLSYTITLSLP